jgi:hypothetical protein
MGCTVFGAMHAEQSRGALVTAGAAHHSQLSTVDLGRIKGLASAYGLRLSAMRCTALGLCVHSRARGVR